MKRDQQYKIMFTVSEMEVLKLEATEMGIPVSDLIRGKLFGTDNVQHNVQDKVQDPLVEWANMCGRMPELNEMRKAHHRVASQLEKQSEAVEMLKSEMSRLYKMVVEIQGTAPDYGIE